MSTHGIQRDPCCVFPADGKTVTKDLFELKGWQKACMPLLRRPSTK